jgi:hypothetical protein
VIAQVDAGRARLIHGNAIVSREIRGILGDVAEQSELVRHVIHEQDRRPAPALHATAEVRELVGGQRIDAIRRIRSAAHIGRVGAGRQRERIRQGVPVRQRGRPGPFRIILQGRSGIETRIE